MRIMVATPSGDTIVAHTATCIRWLETALKGDGFEVGVFNKAGTYVERNQNEMVADGLATGADYILFVDSDMVFPADIGRDLLARDRDIVGCTYRTRQPPHPFASFDLSRQRHTGKEVGVKEALMVPSGLLLVRRKVFEAIGYPWFFNTYGQRPEDFTGNDANFCLKSRAAGFRVFCDFYTSKEVKHFGGVAIGWNYAK